jgi:2'-hydroxyisoflavone reductase
MTTRRNFLETTGSVVASVLLGPRALRLPLLADTPRRSKSLDILILGGTGYIGPYQVREAVNRGHRVTVFNRGIHQADLPRAVIHLQGDRSLEKLNLDALRGKTWDAAIDNSQTDPAWVTKTAELLRDSVGYYLYVSSTGVYFPYNTPDIKEDVAPLLVDPDGTTRSYGVRKALSELENAKVFGNRAINVRPNFIVGPGDESDRFMYWPARYARGGEILVPGSRDDHVQFADVRDLTSFMIRLIEEGRTGTFNIAGDDTVTMQKFQDALGSAIPAPSRTLTWIPDLAFLREQRFRGSIPWVAPKLDAQGRRYGQVYINSDKAVAAGLRYRPMTETIRDSLAWWHSLPPDRRANNKFAATPRAEADALKAWHAKMGG